MNDESRTAFATLYQATLAPLRRYLGRMLRDPDEAQDLAHEAYARVYRSWEANSVSRPAGLLFTTARRLALNHIKRRASAPVTASGADNLIPFIPSPTPGVEQAVMAHQEWEQLQQAIGRLPVGCRQVLLLCKLEDLTHAEIAHRLGIAISTVEKQHARALRLLRTALAQQARPGPENTEAFGGAER